MRLDDADGANGKRRIDIGKPPGNCQAAYVFGFECQLIIIIRVMGVATPRRGNIASCDAPPIG
eukprot:1184607-Prorocentrum_minimum.AAC.1